MTRRSERTPVAQRLELRFAGPVVIAVLALGATLMTLAPDTTGPGVTCDELYHVAAGKRLVVALRHQGPAFFSRANIARNFDWPADGPPVHPPLGNWLLGWSYHLFDPAPDSPSVGSIMPARFAPALALGLLVLLVGAWTAQAEGPLAGWVAAAAVVLVPRVFAHGHLAALDMMTALLLVASVLTVAGVDTRGGRLGWCALAGLVWGLAMLTRIHGLLLVPPIALWLLWRMRLRAVLPLVVWGASGMATFVAGWPWLWFSPLAHLRQFLGTATHRQAIHVFYLGRVWEDHQVPWHYPLVTFLVIVPLGLLLLGFLGLWAKRRAAKESPGHLLVIGTLVFMLAVFAWPGVPVYDGGRLFLMVFPLWAIWVGVGARWLVEHRVWRSLPQQARVWLVGGLVAAQGLGLVVYHPCQLSHYSLLVGGLWGAEKLGFEVNYWGDAVRESLLVEAVRRGRGAAVLFAPNLAPWQAKSVALASPTLMETQVALEGWDQRWNRPARGLRYVVLYNRKADLGAISEELRSAKVILEHRKQGVWLARLIEVPPPSERVGVGDESLVPGTGRPAARLALDGRSP